MKNVTFSFAVIFAVAIAADFITVEAFLRNSGKKTPDRGGWSAEAPYARSLNSGETAPGTGGRHGDVAPDRGDWSAEAPLIIRTDRRIARSVHNGEYEDPIYID